MFLIDAQQLTQQLPKLSNLESLDIGGFKAVISAEHQDYGSVVLKLIHNPSEPERLQREIAFQIEHHLPNVPTLFEHGQITYVGQSVYFLIEERVPGSNLGKVLSNVGPLSIENGISLLETLLVIASAYEPLNLVHRDIKPANIICKDDNSFWLLDFGIARHLDQQSLTPTAFQIGPSTLGYASPEQLLNIKAAVNIQTDLFAIGVVGYEGLTGANPFLRNGRTQEGFLYSVNNPLPPLIINGYSQDALYEFLSTLTGKLPSYRPPSASYALNWLREIRSNISENDVQEDSL